MNKSRPDDPHQRRAPAPRAPAPSGGAGGKAEDVQPPPTGAKRGSPAAPVMKQFQKTRSESTGRS